MLAVLVAQGASCASSESRLVAGQCVADSRLGGAAHLEAMLDLPDNCQWPQSIAAYRPDDPKATRFQISLGTHTDVAMPTGVWTLEAELPSRRTIQVPGPAQGAGDRCNVRLVMTSHDCDLRNGR